MKKNYFSLMLMVCLFLANQVSAQTNYYFGSSGVVNGNVWSTTEGGPYDQFVDMTTGGILNFNVPAIVSGPTTGWSVTKGINVNANIKFTSHSGSAMSSLGSTVYPIYVAAGVTFDGGEQAFGGQTAGVIKNGPGTLCFLNGPNNGGYTLNEGTIISSNSPNSFGAGAFTVNGGTIAANNSMATRDFSAKFSSFTIGGDFTLGALTSVCPTSFSTASMTFGAANIGNVMRKITIGGLGTYSFGTLSSSGSEGGIEVLATAAGVLAYKSANSYVGGTKLTSGIFQLGAANTLAGNLILNGGTFRTGATNGFANASGGTLQLTDNSTIILRSGIHSINFNASNTVAWTPGKKLDIKGWLGVAGTTGTAGQVFIGTDATGVTAEQLAQITVNGNPAAILETGEIVSTVNGLITAPSLVAPTGGTVDFDASITFADNPDWRAAITAVKILNATLIPGIDYEFAPGVLTLHPSGLNPVLAQTVGGRLLSIESTGYTNASISVNLAAGTPTQMIITKSPQAPTSNVAAAALFAQPVIIVQDQYGNKSGTFTVTAEVASGSWTLGGNTTVTCVAGTATFAGLTATNTNPLDMTPASIKFSTAAGPFTVTSGTFTLPILTAATTPTIDAPYDITFTENAAWRNAIADIYVGGVRLDPSAYNKTVAGKITFTPSASILLQTTSTKSIFVLATGFPNQFVSQAMTAGAAVKLGVTTLPVANTLNAKFTTQPIVTIQDQYGNKVITSTASVTASAGTGGWTLGGTTTVAAVAGVCTFTDLIVNSTGDVADATINFDSAPLTSTNATFNIGTTAIKELLDNSIASIFRNTDNRITIRCTEGVNTNSTVAVYNLTGQKLVSGRLISNTTVLNANLQAGIYLVSVTNANKTVTRKIVLN